MGKMDSGCVKNNCSFELAELRPYGKHGEGMKELELSITYPFFVRLNHESKLLESLQKLCVVWLINEKFLSVTAVKFYSLIKTFDFFFY